ncbi:cadmium-translocating P-type ATPase [Candidatus Daviesbacteria bacterium]|nr:cadmium-translocating P-type ATPase [Candidatus Daviesbacteria bacterium]
MTIKVLFSKQFRIPLTVLIGILAYLVLKITGQTNFANISIISVTILGSYQLFWQTLKDLIKKRFALDYIAILAISVSLYTQQYLVAGILALMITSGRTLEDYAVSQAKKSLTGLIDRIPSEVLLWETDKAVEKVKIKDVQIGQEIFIRKGEVIPLDGNLVSPTGQTDESTLTGEPYFIDKIEGDVLRSGTVNVGNPIIIEVTKTEGNSTYSKIIELVKKAQEEQSPFVRLADRYSTFFTLITLGIAAFAYITSNFDLTRVLSVLAIATPCPLIIATPVALLGGVNSAAKRRIIIKKLASLENLAKIDTIVFDKTGTITLGRPKLTEVTLQTKSFTEKQILGIAESLERNSLHPLAKAVVAKARQNHAPLIHAKQVAEIIGYGISGIVGKEKFTLSKVKNDLGMTIELTSKGRTLALFKFEDELKTDTQQSFEKLRSFGLDLKIFTGDKEQAAKKIVEQLNLNIETRAQMSPEDKLSGVKDLQKMGKTVAMIGDGINDAPALALANVGLVFSNEEQTSSSEAADIVFLGGDFTSVFESLNIAKNTIKIAKQSIFFGIGLSIAGMILASFGFIPPIFGAGIQEVIDVAVILNAIRASI